MTMPRRFIAPALDQDILDFIQKHLARGLEPAAINALMSEDMKLRVIENGILLARAESRARRAEEGLIPPDGGGAE